MTVLFYKDGRLLTDEGNPLVGVSLDNLLACISNPADGDTLIYNAEAGMWVPGNPLPVAITEPADGDTLAYDAEAEAWVNTAAAGGEG